MISLFWKRYKMENNILCFFADWIKKINWSKLSLNYFYTLQTDFNGMLFQSIYSYLLISLLNHRPYSFFFLFMYSSTIILKILSIPSPVLAEHSVKRKFLSLAKLSAFVVGTFIDSYGESILFPTNAMIIPSVFTLSSNSLIHTYKLLKLSASVTSYTKIAA